MHRQLFRLLFLLLPAAVLVSCSLIVDSELEGKPAPDAGAGDLSVPDASAPDANTPRITGENGNTGPFLIGEQISVPLSSEKRDQVTTLLIGSSLARATNCPGKLVGDRFVCQIGALTPGGDTSYQAAVPGPLVAESGDLQIRRLVLVAPFGATEVSLHDARTIKQVGSITLPGKLSAGPQGRVSTMGRFALFAFQDSIAGDAPTLALVDLVLRKAVSLGIKGDTVRQSSFEPRWGGSGGARLPLESKWLWAVDGTGKLYRVELPELPKTIADASPTPIDTGRGDVVRVIWAPDTGVSPPAKHLLGLARTGTEVFIYDPVTKTYGQADAGPASTSDPGAKPVDLTYIRRKDGDGELRAVVISVGAADGWADVYTFSGSTITRADIKQSSRLRLNFISQKPLLPVAVHAVPGTATALLSYTSYPETQYSFVYSFFNGVGVGAVAGSISCTAGLASLGLPANVGTPRRYLYASGDQLSVLSTASEDSTNYKGIIVAPFKVDLLQSAVHHRNEQRFYALTRTSIKQYSYVVGTKTDVVEQLKSPINGGGLAIQP